MVELRHLTGVVFRGTRLHLLRYALTLMYYSLYRTKGSNVTTLKLVVQLVGTKALNINWSGDRESNPSLAHWIMCRAACTLSPHKTLGLEITRKKA